GLRVVGCYSARHRYLYRQPPRESNPGPGRTRRRRSSVQGVGISSCHKSWSGSIDNTPWMMATFPARLARASYWLRNSKKAALESAQEICRKAGGQTSSASPTRLTQALLLPSKPSSAGNVTFWASQPLEMLLVQSV